MVAVGVRAADKILFFSRFLKREKENRKKPEQKDGCGRAANQVLYYRRTHSTIECVLLYCIFCIIIIVL